MAEVEKLTPPEIDPYWPHKLFRAFSSISFDCSNACPEIQPPPKADPMAIFPCFNGDPFFWESSVENTSSNIP